MTNNKKIYAFILGAIISIIFVTIITILADLYLPLKDFLKAVFAHHWIGKGILAIAIFLIAALLINLTSYNIDDKKILKRLSTLLWISIISSLILMLFFLYEAFLK